MLKVKRVNSHTCLPNKLQQTRKELAEKRDKDGHRAYPTANTKANTKAKAGAKATAAMPCVRTVSGIVALVCNQNKMFQNIERK